jgi:hypothetical protein
MAMLWPIYEGILQYLCSVIAEDVIEDVEMSVIYDDDRVNDVPEYINRSSIS